MFSFINILRFFTIVASPNSCFKTAFEAVFNGSWQPVELLKIESGKTTLRFIDTEQIQSTLSSDIRIRSRKATSSDCSSFLRPGIDISMLLGYRYNDNSDQFRSIPVSSNFLSNCIS